MKLFEHAFKLIRYIFLNKSLISSLAYDEFKSQYLGSYLGVLWAIIRPLLFVGVIWFIFGVGFKAKPTDDGVPFILWLLCGLVPWFFFADAVNKSVSAITANAYLVRKSGFKVDILPLVKVLSALGIHMVFITILLIVFILHGYYPTLYWVQLPFLLLSMIIMLLGMGWLTSSLRVFIKDVNEIIAVVIQFGFWLTPIFWSLKLIPESYQVWVKLNPMYYIINAYRTVLLEQQWIAITSSETLIFISTVFMLLIIGALCFSRLKPHFGDVL